MLVRTPATQRRGGIFALLVAALLSLPACHSASPATRPDPPSPAQLAQLWAAPQGERDLFLGIGGARLAPDPAARYTVIEIKRSGFSRGYTVKGPRDRQYSAKFPPEAATEVIASRIHWGIGYHQPPIYLMPAWTADQATSPNPQQAARFRESKPDLHGLDAKGSWSYARNPFVGTPQLSGLVVLQAMLGNSDLKDDNNVIYELDEALEGARTWYVPRDLGHTFGRTGRINAPRGDIAVFEQTPFIKGIVNGRVRFDWRGRHGALLRDITPDDVRWICGRLALLTDRQWQDAFRAGGLAPDLADRFIHRLKQKIAEGLALEP